ncbi:iron chelate uptake ABC transporter family permease subunit [Planobispora takensis]|uniref:ABC transporter permease n=1 Tax=Planobispora takensis TaxID=1367882 RepID=A0A8J3WU67_9ACTN|nr:iron chelate uptake ABC transporter family permease subunit [Planobispora takensis]GII01178.1 ABC transporter permease [Planobispora takensis]
MSVSPPDGSVSALHPAARGKLPSATSPDAGESPQDPSPDTGESPQNPPAAHPDAGESAPSATPARDGLSGLSAAALFTAGIAALAGSVVICVRVGSSDVGYSDLAGALGRRLGLVTEPLPPLLDSLIWDLRLPRVLLSALVGASLAVCGAALQAVTRNALADPYLLGVSSGASTGAVAVTVLSVGSGSLGLTGGAFAGALVSFGLLMLLLRRTGLDSSRIVLTGVVVGQLFTALTSLVLMTSGDADITRAITHWLLGSMASARWDAVAVCAVTGAAGMVVVQACAPALDGFSFGADTAASLGVDVRTTRLVLLVTTALLTSTAVASVGAIGFVGLIVPHGVRFLAGPLHRVLLPFTALAGGIFLVWADTLARVAFSPQEVPVGVFTALLGVPLFLLVLRRRGEL